MTWAARAAGGVFVASLLVNALTVYWCGAGPDACIPVHFLVTIPVMFGAGLMFVAGAIAWLLHRNDE